MLPIIWLVGEGIILK